MLTRRRSKTGEEEEESGKRVASRGGGGLGEKEEGREKRLVEKIRMKKGGRASDSVEEWERGGIVSM
eukprot:388953-Hanusia_phi.AAC.5